MALQEAPRMARVTLASIGALLAGMPVMVMRGPGATMPGANAVNGVVNIITHSIEAILVHCIAYIP